MTGSKHEKLGSSYLGEEDGIDIRARSLLGWSYDGNRNPIKETMKREDLKFTTEEEVMFFDTDCAGVVHNIAYLRMIETCRTKLAGEMGMDLVTMSKTQLFPVVVRTEIDYKIPARLGDHLEIHGHISEIGKVKFWCEFTIVRKGEPRPLIKCRQALALVQMPAGKPQRLPADWLAL